MSHLTLADPHTGSGARGAGYIPTLDGWRAAAIALVLFCHARALFAPHGPLASEAVYKAAHGGTAGVDLFFALSGYLITRRLLAERAAAGRIDLVGFYAKRAFRILPPYVAYLVLLAALVKLGVVGLPPRPFFACFVFLRNYVPYSWGGDWFTAHFWSLSVEEHFYMLWPALLLVWLRWPQTGGWLLATAAAILVWRELDIIFRFVDQISGQALATPVWRTDTQIGGLLLGGWAAVVTSQPKRMRVPGWIVWPATTVFFLAALAFHNQPLSPSLITISATVMVVGTVGHPSRLLGRLLESSPVRWLGRISYSLYIWQQMFLVADNGRPLGFLNDAPWCFVATFACAIVSYYAIEQPAIAFGRKVLSSRRKSGS